MRNINKKGFTLIELLAVLMLLALVTGIGSYSIISIINNTKESDYKLLIENINSAVEEYYIECKYGDGDKNGIDCDNNPTGASVELSKLIEYGYLKGNSTKDNGEVDLINPKTKTSILDCKILYQYNNGNFIVRNSGDGCNVFE